MFEIRFLNGSQIKLVGRLDAARQGVTEQFATELPHEGIPALAFKFGYTKGSEEERVQTEWLKTRYHAVSDDLQQPVNKEAAARFTEYLAALVKKIANEKKRPVWKRESFFRRFAR